MKTPPPPPAPAFKISGEPPAVTSQPVAQTAPEAKSASPEDFEKMIGFVNEVRRLCGRDALIDLPLATGRLASQKPLSLALGCSVIKHMHDGPFYALVYKKEVLDALVKCGGGAMTITPRIMSDPTSTMWEVRIPVWLKPFA